MFTVRLSVGAAMLTSQLDLDLDLVLLFIVGSPTFDI